MSGGDQKKGAPGISCSDLSTPVEDGTKATLRTSSNGSSFVVVDDGPHAGLAGFINSKYYSPLD